MTSLDDIKNDIVTLAELAISQVEYGIKVKEEKWKQNLEQVIGQAIKDFKTKLENILNQLYDLGLYFEDIVECEWHINNALYQIDNYISIYGV